ARIFHTYGAQRKRKTKQNHNFPGILCRFKVTEKKETTEKRPQNSGHIPTLRVCAQATVHAWRHESGPDQGHRAMAPADSMLLRAETLA
ncbi:MAG: hypothetical protein JSW29_03970, partial [Candidatus Bathyarchaeota archaeon]